MRNYLRRTGLAGVFLLATCFVVLAQTKDQFNGKFQIGGVAASGSSDFEVTAIYSYNGAKYGAVDIAVGDQIIDTNCRLYTVETIVKTTPYVILGVRDASTPKVSPSTGVGVIFRPTPNNSFPLETNGLSDAMKTCIANYFALAVDGGVSQGAGSGVETASVYYGIASTMGNVSDITNLQVTDSVTNGEYQAKVDLTTSGSGYYTLVLPVGWRNPSFSIGGLSTIQTLMPINTLEIAGVKYLAWQSDVEIPSGQSLKIN